MLELTPEQEVQRSYNAAMDSVTLLGAVEASFRDSDKGMERRPR
jgi:hypothetical protein